MSEFTHKLPHQPWSKPSRNEQEYFHREEFKSRMATARQREARRADEERRRWIEAHANHCPRCGGFLEEIRTAEGTADQCPNCLGVWLDRQTFDRLTPLTSRRTTTSPRSSATSCSSTPPGR